jgi:hypothetical protein
MEPGTSEDGADDISRWVVAQGRDFYQDVHDHPEKTPYASDRREDAQLFPEISEVFYDRFGDEILDHTD